MVRLLKENGLDDICIVGKYEVEGAWNYIPDFTSEIPKYDIYKSQTEGIKEFAVLYGDCYYSEAIIKDLATRKTHKKWLHWCCNRPNKVTGKIWEEGYIHGVYDAEYWFNKCEEYHNLLSLGLEHKSDWMFVRFLLDIDLFTHQPELMKCNEVDWEDETDDMDYAIDYKNWLHNCRGIEIEEWKYE